MNAQVNERRITRCGAWLAFMATGLLVAGCATGAMSSPTPVPAASTATIEQTAVASPAPTPAQSTTTPQPGPIASDAPSATAQLAPVPEPLIVKVARGDTLASIAREHDVALRTLVAANPQIHDPRLIHAGDQVWVPREAMNTTSSGRATSGTLSLFASTTLEADHHGNIVIQTDGVTLDCAGHLVHGPGSDRFSGGIDIAGADNVTVGRCVIAGFVHNGVFGHHGANLRLEDNTVVSSGAHGLAIDTVTSGVVTGNTSRSNGAADPAIGIVITKSTGVAISGNIVWDNPWAGIALLDGTTDSTVESNLASENGAAFIVDSSDGNALAANTAVRNQDGFALLAASGTVVSGNTASRNTNCGFSLDRSTMESVLTGNTANGNHDGFGVHASNANAVKGNLSIANGNFGFVVSGGASDNTLSDNTGLRNGYVDAWEEGTGSGDVWSGNIFRSTSGV